MESQSIASTIQDNEHLKEESYQWYFRKYLIPLNEISVLILLNIFGFITCIIVFFNIISLFPLVKLHKMFTSNNDFHNKHVKFFNISENPNIENDFFNILAKNYIEKVESFELDNTTEQINFVLTNSSKNVVQDFLNYMNYSNPESPIVRYANNFTKNVHILKIENFSDNIIKAQIETHTFSLNNKLTEKFFYEINLKFASNFKLSKHHYQDDQITFFITEYSRKLLKTDILTNN